MIEVEITTENTAYEHVRELVQKICADHEGKRELSIKVILVHPHLKNIDAEKNMSSTNKGTVTRRIYLEDGMCEESLKYRIID